eukprot:SAG22_NODE_645_length_8202_cov_5.985684_2_plen_169_part_00
MWKGDVTPWLAATVSMELCHALLTVDASDADYPADCFRRAAARGAAMAVVAVAATCTGKVFGKPVGRAAVLLLQLRPGGGCHRQEQEGHDRKHVGVGLHPGRDGAEALAECGGLGEVLEAAVEEDVCLVCKRGSVFCRPSSASFDLIAASPNRRIAPLSRDRGALRLR